MSNVSDNSKYFLQPEEQPAWLKYPAVFTRVLEAKLTDFHPWHILPREKVLSLRELLASHFYPEEALVPLAHKTDSDEVACFDKANPRGITIFNLEFRGRSGRVRTYSSFYDWFRSAVNDFLEFEPSEDGWTR